MKSYRESCILCQNNTTLAEMFHEQTALSKRNGHIFSRSIARAFDNPNYIEKKEARLEEKILGKKAIKLRPDEGKGFEAILKRSSVRKFENKSLKLKELSTILRYGYGRSERGAYTVPSAGGNYPIRLIVVVNNIENVPSGMYEYINENHSLERLNDFNYQQYPQITQSMTLTNRCAFSIHFIGTMELMCYKYQDRGYRFMNIECGHIAQNMLLISEKIGIGAVCSGGFLDGDFIDFLEKQGHKEFSDYIELYEMFFGYSSEENII